MFCMLCLLHIIVVSKKKEIHVGRINNMFNVLCLIKHTNCKKLVINLLPNITLKYPAGTFSGDHNKHKSNYLLLIFLVFKRFNSWFIFKICKRKKFKLWITVMLVNGKWDFHWRSLMENMGLLFLSFNVFKELWFVLRFLPINLNGFFFLILLFIFCTTYNESK